jgi:hypothetical protein
MARTSMADDAVIELGRVGGGRSAAPAPVANPTVPTYLVRDDALCIVRPMGTCECALTVVLLVLILVIIIALWFAATMVLGGQAA